MGACGAFQVARAGVRGGMLCVRACRRAPPAVCMPKRPRIRSARAGQRPAPRHHQGEGPTAISGRDSALARARSTVKCCQNPGQIKSETRSDKIRTGGQMNRNPHAEFEVCDVPVLPIRAMSALRAVVDAFFLSETQPTRGRCDDAKTENGGAGRSVPTGRSGGFHVHGAEGGSDRPDERADIGGDDEPGPGGGGRRS